VSARSYVGENGQRGNVVLVKYGRDAKELARLYVDERLTVEEVARRMGCSETTVRRRLRSHALDVRSRGPRRREPGIDGWTRERAYAIGLLATDGNLSRDGRHLTVTSADPDLLGVLRTCLALQANVRQVGSRGRCYRVQWSDRRFYEWVESIGLSPAKSRTLGTLTIPDEYFADFARGCIDGDGSIVVYVDRYHSAKDARYVYERLYVTLVSASRPFVDWFRARLLRFVAIRGSISERTSRSGRPYWVLRYARRESSRLLPWIYYAPSVLCLARKRARSEPFLRLTGTS
jgi:AraC-like DNA-binding protein